MYNASHNFHKNQKRHYERKNVIAMKGNCGKKVIVMNYNEVECEASVRACQSGRITRYGNSRVTN